MATDISRSSEPINCWISIQPFWTSFASQVAKVGEFSRLGRGGADSDVEGVRCRKWGGSADPRNMLETYRNWWDFPRTAPASWSSGMRGDLRFFESICLTFSDPASPQLDQVLRIPLWHQLQWLKGIFENSPSDRGWSLEQFSRCAGEIETQNGSCLQL